MALLLLVGLLSVAALFPLLGDARRQGLRQRWSRALVAALGLRLETEGAPPSPGALIVANHISWVDVFAINAISPAAFISKAEVRDWPLIGWLAARNDTVFLRRGSRGHARVINDEIVRQMSEGKPVALFPEGTTTDGSHLLHFHGALLQPAIEARATVAPIAIRYLARDGSPSIAAAYVGELSLLDCIRNIVAARGLRVRLACLPALRDELGTRKELNARLHAAIAARLGVGAVAARPSATDAPRIAA